MPIRKILTVLFILGVSILSFNAVSAKDAHIEMLRAQLADFKVHALGDFQVRALGSSTENWGVPAIGADKYTNYLNQKAGEKEEITVAVLDTGVNFSHNVFVGSDGSSRLDTNNNLIWNYIDGTNDVADDNGHGTAVAGTIAQSTPDNVKILPIKVMDYNGNGNLDNVAAAVERVYRYVDAICLSLGGEIEGDFTPEDVDSVYPVFKNAYEHGTLISAAAGNEAKHTVLYPASSPYTFGVSAIDSDYHFATTYPAGGGSNYGPEVDFAMPGKEVVVPWGIDYMVGNGTSISAPFLTASIALIKSDHPEYTKEEITATLKVNATNPNDEKDEYYGYGYVKFDFYNIPSGIYVINSALNSSLALDIAGGSEDDTANVQIWDNNGTVSQKFIIRNLHDNIYEIEGLKSSRLLDVAGGETNSGTNVWQYSKNETCAQHWSIAKNEDDTYSFISECGELALDVAGGQANSGTNIQVWEPNQTASQKFNLELVEPISGQQIIPDGDYAIGSELSSDKGLDIAGGSIDNSANLQLYTFNSTPAQTFHIAYLADGFYKIINTNSEKALDVSGAGTYNGANVWQYGWNGTIAQQWLIKENSDGTYSLSSRCNDLYLDVSGGQSTDGTNIQIWENNQTLSQKFAIIAQ